MVYEVIWIFIGDQSTLPSGVFSSRELAEEWISKNALTGLLTAYPINISLYEWALERGHFVPKKEIQKTPAFIQNFASAYLEHYHYENGSV